MSFSPQIVSAVQYCHQKCIVHRDLKVRTGAALTHITIFLFFSSLMFDLSAIAPPGNRGTRYTINQHEQPSDVRSL